MALDTVVGLTVVLIFLILFMFYFNRDSPVVSFTLFLLSIIQLMLVVAVTVAGAISADISGMMSAYMNIILIIGGMVIFAGLLTIVIGILSMGSSTMSSKWGTGKW